MSDPIHNERRYVRVKSLRPVHFVYDGHRYEGVVRDISLCGIYILSEHAVEIGRKVSLETYLPNPASDRLSLRGRIARVVPPQASNGGQQSEEPGFALDFAAISLANRRVIDEYVRHTFRVFRKLQFELSKEMVDENLVHEILRETYLPERRYGIEGLRNLVAAELAHFRLRPL